MAGKFFPTVKFALAITALLALGLSPQAALAQGVIQGTVTDAETGLPLEGVMVRAWPADGIGLGPGHGGSHGGGHGGGGGGGGWWQYKDVTAADGTYLIDELPAGTYLVFARLSGYFRGEAEVAVADGEATLLDFALEPLSFGTVAGTVTDADTGLPISGALVKLRRDVPTAGLLGPGPGHGHGGGPGGLKAMTGDDGMYIIENVPVGDYTAVAMCFGYTPADPVPVTVLEGETATVDFALEPMVFGALEGHVTDAVTGNPVEGALVKACRDLPGRLGPGHGGWHGGHGGHAVETDENGFYRFDQLCAGAYLVRVFADGYVPAEVEAEVFEDQTTVADVVLDPAGLSR